MIRHLPLNLRSPAVLLECILLICALAVPLSARGHAQDPEDQPANSTAEKNQSPALEADDSTEAAPAVQVAHHLHPDEEPEPFFKSDAVIFGILMLILGFVFWSSNSEVSAFKKFYRFVPMLLMCYFLPSLLTVFGLVNAEESKLYYVATRYLLPACLVLLTLSIDLKEVFKLGPKALIMFLTGTAGVVLGGPLAVVIVATFAPEIIGVDGPAAVWRGLSTVAGSWIGGGANQAAMQVVFMSPPEGATGELKRELSDLYSVMVAVDVLVAEAWMVFLLFGVGKAKEIDRFFKADSSAIESLKRTMEDFSATVTRIPSSKDLMLIAAIGFGATAFAHFFGGQLAATVEQVIVSNPVKGFAGEEVTAKDSQFGYLKDLGLTSSFFWLIVLSTTVGVALSFTPLRNLEGAGASKIGTVFIFILVAVIGMGMNIRAVFDYPGFFLVGGIWMTFHVALLFLVGWLIRAPYFFLAVGSKANIGGAASAPVVAAAFHPALAPVGVLLAVLGYALGTYGAMICSWMMQAATPG